MKRLWICRIFKDEFGFSDVRSNYSRVYSWMANQLGHFTLGLATALLFYWTISLVEVVCDCLAATSTANTGVPAGVTLACAVATICIYLISRDRPFRCLGYFAVLGTWVLTPGIFAQDGWIPPGTWLALQYPGIIVAALTLLCSIWWWFRFSSHPTLDFDRWVHFIASACVCAFLIASSLWAGYAYWTTPVGAALISMAIWVCKEFGGDMPNVSKELKLAREQRKGLKRKCQVGCKTDKGEILERNYLATAKWDSRTDTMFYLAGAWIAAGIIFDSASGNASAEALQSAQDRLALGVVFSGLAFFLGFFLLCGKNWAYRQQAIDRTGATRGNMLAVIDSCIELVNDKCREVNEARLELYYFARGKTPNDCSLQHLVVFGAGRYNERLADALVTEAALASLPPGFYSPLREEKCWRRARKLSFARLLDYDPVNLMMHELPYNPVTELCVVPVAGASQGVRKVCAEQPAGSQTKVCSQGDVEMVPAANLVVVTRCNPRKLCEAVAKLSRNQDQNTVWCFDEKYGRCAETKGKILEMLCSKLSKGNNIGIVFCIAAGQGEENQAEC